MERYNKKFDESYIDDNKREIDTLVKLTGNYDKAKGILDNHLHNMLSSARKQGRKDIIDSINKVIDTFDKSFKFEMSLMELEKLLKI